MENASKALLMAGGILLGILILSLMVTLFVGAGNLSKSYEEGKKADAIQKFNSNFTKYLGKDITTHEAVTISNFAKIENNKIKEVTVNNSKNETNIVDDLDEANEEYKDEYIGESKKVETVYKLKIENYDNDGYISEVSITDRRIVATDITM